MCIRVYIVVWYLGGMCRYTAKTSFLSRDEKLFHRCLWLIAGYAKYFDRRAGLYVFCLMQLCDMYICDMTYILPNDYIEYFNGELYREIRQTSNVCFDLLLLFRVWILICLLVRLYKSFFLFDVVKMLKFEIMIISVYKVSVFMTVIFHSFAMVFF